MIERTPTSSPLSRMQLVVAELVGAGFTLSMIAGELAITSEGVRHHVKAAAAKIDSDLPALQRVVAWARGASSDVLTGNALKLDVITRQQQQQRTAAASHGGRSRAGRIVQTAENS